ncbi:MAG TPA: hypothetical protein VFO81_09070 [Gaiellaceae bacterium]|nr:hypothetical protein [Gaiellaceae bacterium]
MTRTIVLGALGLALAVVLGLGVHGLTRDTVARPVVRLEQGPALAPPVTTTTTTATTTTTSTARSTTTGEAETETDDDDSGRGRGRGRGRGGGDD